MKVLHLALVLVSLFVSISSCDIILFTNKAYPTSCIYAADVYDQAALLFGDCASAPQALREWMVDASGHIVLVSNPSFGFGLINKAANKAGTTLGFQAPVRLINIASDSRLVQTWNFMPATGTGSTGYQFIGNGQFTDVVLNAPVTSTDSNSQVWLVARQPGIYKEFWLQAPNLAALQPTAAPSKAPSASPSQSPSKQPTGSPSAVPSKVPTGSPSQAPSASPSSTPSVNPTTVPTSGPVCGVACMSYFNPIGGTNWQLGSIGTMEMFDDSGYQYDINLCGYDCDGTNSVACQDSYRSLGDYCSGNITAISATEIKVFTWNGLLDWGCPGFPRAATITIDCTNAVTAPTLASVSGGCYYFLGLQIPLSLCGM